MAWGSSPDWAAMAITGIGLPIMMISLVVLAESGDTRAAPDRAGKG